MSIELCNITGSEVSTILVEKLVDPKLAVKVGGVAIDHLTGVAHREDGSLVVDYRDSQDELHTFSFSSFYEPFADTAIHGNGEPVCIGCTD